jgi:hypothetical protein
MALLRSPSKDAVWEGMPHYSAPQGKRAYEEEGAAHDDEFGRGVRCLVVLHIVEAMHSMETI